MAFSSSSSSSDNELRDNALVVLRQNLAKAKQEKDDLKLKLEKFQTSFKNLSELLASQTIDKTGLGYNFQVFTRAMFDCDDYLSFGSDESSPPSPIYDRYQSGNGYHVVLPPYTRTFMPPKPDLVFSNAPNDVEIHHPTFNVKLSPTKPKNDLSHTHRPLAPIIEDWISDLEDESETKTSQNVPSFIQPTEQVKSPRPSVQLVETSIPTTNPKIAIPKPTNNGKCRNRKACFVCKSLTHLIKDSILTQSKLVPITTVKPVTAAVLKISVTRPRQAKTIVTKPTLPPRRHINRSPSPKASTFPPKVIVVKAPMVNAAKGNPQHALKYKGVIYNGCSRNMIGNMSYLSDFKELNGGYIAFGDNPKGGKISGKGKIKIGKLDFDDVYFVNELKFNHFSVSHMCDKKNIVLFTDTKCLVLSPKFKLPDETQVLLKVPKENNMYNVDLKNIVPYGDLTCKFDRKVDEGFLVRYSVSGKENVQQYVLFLVWSSGSINPHNTDGDAAFDKKEPEFERRKPESEVNVSLSSSAQLKKHDDKTKREAKGKSLVDSLTGYRNLSTEFKDFSNNSINEDNAAGTLVPAVRKIFPNSTNTFSAVGPSNAAASPTHRKYSYIDTFQYPDDPNMPELEDITFSDDKDDVGAAADFNNLETSITVSRIPTTRVHKDHLMTQIIGDLSSATQTRSMTWVAKDQGGLSQINNYDFHTCIFACFLSQKEPKRVHQALKDPIWIEAMQEELLQFKMQKVWVLVDLPYRKRAIGTKWEEGIDYQEVFAPLARIEAIRLFLAYASFMGFMVYQTDVKSAFLYGTIKEEVYVYQPLGFEDTDYPDKIYVDDIIFGSTNKDLCKAFKKLMKDKFQMSLMGELTFFLGLQEKGIDYEEVFAPLTKIEAIRLFLAYASFMGFMVYQTDVKSAFLYGTIKEEVYVYQPPGFEDTDYPDKIYVDDIIFGSINKDLCKAFKKLMKDKFRMSLMGELTFFLALQVKQKKDGIFISQDKYVVEILKKFGLTEGKLASTPIDTEKPLLKDLDGEDVDMYTYRSMIGSLMYLTLSRPDRVNTPRCDEERLELIELTIFLLPSDEKVGVKEVNDVTRLQALVDKKKVIITEATIRDDLRLDDAEGRKFNFLKYIFDSLVRNVDSSTKFYMYPHFLELMIRKQVGDLSTHTIKYTSPTLTHKVDESSAEVNVKDVSTASVAAEGDVSAAVDVVPTVVEEPSISSPKPPTPPPQPSQDQSSTSQGRMIADMDVDVDVILEDVKEVVVEKSADVEEIDDIQGRQAERKGVVIRDLQETATPSTIIHSKVKSKDKGKGILDEVIDHVQRKQKEDNDVKRNIVGFKMDYFKGMTYDDIRPIFGKNFNSNVAFLMKTKEQMDEEDSRALKRLSESQDDKTAKKQKLDEEVEELRRHLQIVLNDEDDVYT
nr:hypothetical protein [Tanacetum cinerariifolium]